VLLPNMHGLQSDLSDWRRAGKASNADMHPTLSVQITSVCVGDILSLDRMTSPVTGMQVAGLGRAHQQQRWVCAMCETE